MTGTGSQNPRVVAGRYRLTGVLGRGGMGVVWRASDELIGRTVAVKELRAPQDLSDEERELFSERALREARTAGRVNHPAVVAIHDLVPVTADDDAVYIVMELVEARSLGEILKREGALPEERVARLGLRALEALNAAHAIGLVHRDVKPSNILVLPGDNAKLVDFGIAHAVDDTRLTRHGVAGSTGYMAPELFEGDSPSPAADLWSLGATLFHAVAGTGPFDRPSTAATLHAILYDDPPSLVEYPSLAPLIGGLLTRDRAHRMTTEQALTVLRAAADATPATQGEPGAVTGPDPEVDADGGTPRSTWEAHSTNVRPASSPQHDTRATQDPNARPGQSTWESHPTSVRSAPPPTPPRSAQRTHTVRGDRYVRSVPTALAVLALAQMMVVLNTTSTNFADLISDLPASPSSGSWFLRSYALAFCGLLLFGCRAGDVFGRRRLLRIGIVVFVLASVLGGFASSLSLLISGRLLQGAGAALVAPNALALIATTFPVGKHRIRAMGVYAAVAGGGPAVGLLLGEVLTNGLNWRWVFLANVPVGLAVLAGTRALIDSERQNGRLAGAGTVTATGALIALLCGIPSNPHLDHWTDGLSLASFAVASSLFIAFLIIQVRSRQRMTLRLLKNRNRSGSLATILFVASGMSWAFFWKLIGTDQAGAAYIPFIIGIWGAASVALALVSRFAPRFVAGAGLLVASGGMFWFSRVGDSLDAAHAWPALFFIGVGSGFVFVPMTLGALGGIAYEEAGVASGLLNTAQQLGGALGLAAVSTIYTSRLDGVLRRSVVGDGSQPAPPTDLPSVVGTTIAHAHQVASLAAAGLLLLGLAIVLIAVNAKAQNHDGDGPSPRDRTSSAVS